MDSPRPSSRSSARRSYPNLHSLSLAPLSARFPLDASTPPSPSADSTRAPRTSYLAHKSAPATPGILSLSQSRSSSCSGRRAESRDYAYGGYFAYDERATGEIPKAKSTSTLHPGVIFADEPRGSEKRHHTRKGTAPLPLRAPHVRHHTADAHEDWLLRAGLAITGETRESKGQSWLVRRESSISLVQERQEYGAYAPNEGRRMALLSGEQLSESELPTFSPSLSPRVSRVSSRIQSRIGSRVPSARQSRRGSRSDLLMTAGVKQVSSRQSFDLPAYVANPLGGIEPDFVDGDGESDGDEEEVARLARERGFGLGTWVDRLIGWTLFSVDEDGEGSEEEDEDANNEGLVVFGGLSDERLRLQREVEAKRRKLEREAIIAASAFKTPDNAPVEPQGGNDIAEAAQRQSQNEDGGGWADAAWFLTVASKALF